MIVREIIECPQEVLRTFDWLNDYGDTRSYLVRKGGNEELLSILDGKRDIWVNNIRALFEE